MNSKKIVRIFMTLMLVSIIESCSTAKAGNNQVISKELQSSVPFQIIIPTYLPSDIKDITPIIEGPWANSPAINVTSLRLVYNAGETSPKSIIIDEQNLPVRGDPIVGDTIFILNNVQVEEGPFYTSGAQNLTGKMYDWNSGNLNFTIDIVGYDEIEARKIIDSMIQ
jgi:hypothetical protein